MSCATGFVAYGTCNQSRCNTSVPCLYDGRLPQHQFSFGTLCKIDTVGPQITYCDLEGFSSSGCC